MKSKKKQKRKRPPSRTASLRRQMDALLREKTTIVTGQIIEVDFFELKDLLDWVEAQEANHRTMGKVFKLAAQVQFPVD